MLVRSKRKQSKDTRTDGPELSSRAIDGRTLAIAPYAPSPLDAVPLALSRLDCDAQQLQLLLMAEPGQATERPGIAFQALDPSPIQAKTAQLFACGAYDNRTASNRDPARYCNGEGHDLRYWLSHQSLAELHVYGLFPHGSEILPLLRDACPQVHLTVHLNDLSAMWVAPHLAGYDWPAIPSTKLLAQRIEGLSEQDIKRRWEKIAANMAVVDHCELFSDRLAEWLTSLADTANLAIHVRESALQAELLEPVESDECDAPAILVASAHPHERGWLAQKLSKLLALDDKAGRITPLHLLMDEPQSLPDSLRAHPRVQIHAAGRFEAVLERSDALITLDNGWRALDVEQQLADRFALPLYRWML